MVAGYCTDALADLVAGAGELYGQRRSARFFFDAEPQELRWVLRARGDTVNVHMRDDVCDLPHDLSGP